LLLLLGCLWVEVSGLFARNDKMMLGTEALGYLVSVILTVIKIRDLQSGPYSRFLIWFDETRLDIHLRIQIYPYNSTAISYNNIIEGAIG
jgi:hypothetical protein